MSDDKAEVARLKSVIERQEGALKQFEVANKRIAMARAPAELKEAANAARRNEAGVQEANAVLTEEVERLLAERDEARDKLAVVEAAFEGMNKNCVAAQDIAKGLAAALREAKKLGTHRIAAGDNYACDVADIADEALAKYGAL